MLQRRREGDKINTAEEIGKGKKHKKVNRSEEENEGTLHKSEVPRRGHTHRLENKVHRVSKRKRQTDAERE